MMKSMVEFIKKQPNFLFGTFDLETTVPRDYPEALRDHVGNWYGGKLSFSYPRSSIFDSDSDELPRSAAESRVAADESRPVIPSPVQSFQEDERPDAATFIPRGSTSGLDSRRVRRGNGLPRSGSAAPYRSDERGFIALCRARYRAALSSGRSVSIIVLSSADTSRRAGKSIFKRFVNERDTYAGSISVETVTRISRSARARNAQETASLQHRRVQRSRSDRIRSAAQRASTPRVSRQRRSGPCTRGGRGRENDPRARRWRRLGAVFRGARSSRFSFDRAARAYSLPSWPVRWREDT